MRMKKVIILAGLLLVMAHATFAEQRGVLMEIHNKSIPPDFVTQKCPFRNWLINNILYLCIPLFWGTQKVF